MQLATGMSGNTQRPRRRELEQAALIYELAEERRPTKSGRLAAVWCITVLGERVLASEMARLIAAQERGGAAA